MKYLKQQAEYAFVQLTKYLKGEDIQAKYENLTKNSKIREPD